MYFVNIIFMLNRRRLSKETLLLIQEGGNQDRVGINEHADPQITNCVRRELDNIYMVSSGVVYDLNYTIF